LETLVHVYLAGQNWLNDSSLIGLLVVASSKKLTLRSLSDRLWNFFLKRRILPLKPISQV
jgi:hypothetical protein